jgi:serine/threonine protein kinase
VYLARDLVEADFSDQPFLAIKVLKPDFRRHPDALKALHEEVRKSRALAHQNIVSVYTFDRDGAVVFMTMEHLEGKPLNKLIDDEFPRGMPFTQAWSIIEGAGRALAHAHDRGVVHSDFKPSNVFVTAGGRAKVLDFGIARAMRRSGDGRFDAASLGALTEAYASIEMLGGHPADVRDDVYAFGCVMYELLSGRHVFAGLSAVDARRKGMKFQPLSGLTRVQNAALAKALAFDAGQRAVSIEEVVEGLKVRHRRGLALWSTLAGVCVMALVVAGWWGVQWYAANNDDTRFVNSLLKPNAAVDDSVDPEQVRELIDQGDDYLAQAHRQFDPARLSEGVSTAYGAYQIVLRRDPANRHAAEGILGIVKLYESQARELQEQQQYKRAATLVGYALKLAPERRTLKRLQAELEPLAHGQGG